MVSEVDASHPDSWISHGAVEDIWQWKNIVKAGFLPSKNTMQILDTHSLFSPIYNEDRSRLLEDVLLNMK